MKNLTLISRKAKDGKLFTASITNYGEGSFKAWAIDNDTCFTFRTKKEAETNARLVLKNMVENYNDTH